MSTNVGSIHYDLKLDTSAFDKATDRINKKLNDVGNKMKSIGKKMTIAVTLPVVAGFTLAVKAASDLEETINKVDVSFKDQASVVKDWSKTSIKSMGLAQESALDATALFGDMSTSMGLNTKESSAMSMNLTQLGADLASFKNIRFEEAQTALAGVFTGETESLKRLGVVMTETNLDAFRLANGIKKPIREMTQAEKVQLRYKYIMEQTKNAQGDFARTSDSTANQIRQTQERFKELSAELGKKMIPIMTILLKKLNRLVSWFTGLSPKMQNTILVVIGFTAVLGPLVFGIGTLITAIKGISIALAFVAGTPHILAITLAIMGIALLAGVVIKHWDTLKRWFNNFLTFIKSVFDSIKEFINSLRDKFNALPGWVKSALKGIGDIIIAPFKAPFTWVADKINWLLEKLNALTGKASETKNKFEGVGAGGITADGIVNSTFAKGGFTGRGGVNEVAGLVHRGEYVVPKNQVDQATGTPKMGGANSTNIYGNITIGSNADADNFFKRLSRNQELSFKGLPTRSGSLG